MPFMRDNIFHCQIKKEVKRKESRAIIGRNVRQQFRRKDDRTGEKKI